MCSFNDAQIKMLEEINVCVVYLFGSYAEGKLSPISDIDIGVLFDPVSRAYGETGKAYHQLYDIFTDAFRDRHIDIVFLQKAPLELRFDVITHGKILYESSRGQRQSFEEKTALFYADFKPILNEYNRVILNRA